jgi:hypothetical protein
MIKYISSDSSKVLLIVLGEEEVLPSSVTAFVDLVKAIQSAGCLELAFSCSKWINDSISPKVYCYLTPSILFVT